jgi:hypothetical protein
MSRPAIKGAPVRLSEAEQDELRTRLGGTSAVVERLAMHEGEGAM